MDTTVLSPDILIWILALGFIGMAIWMLIPDELGDETESINKWQRFGVFGATFILFFWPKSVIKPRLPRLPCGNVRF